MTRPQMWVGIQPGCQQGWVRVLGDSCSVQGPCSPVPSPALGSPSAAGCTGTPTPGTCPLHPHPPPAPTPAPRQTFPPWAPGLPRPCVPRHDVTRCHGNAAASLRCSGPQSWDFRGGCVAWAAGRGTGIPGGVGCHGCCRGSPHGRQQPLPVPMLLRGTGAAGTGGGCRIRAMMGH